MLVHLESLQDNRMLLKYKTRHLGCVYCFHLGILKQKSQRFQFHTCVNSHYSTNFCKVVLCFPTVDVLISESPEKEMSFVT